MSDREAFLAAVVANPGDDLPRLVFADWLDENGEPERAELIRLQVEAARDGLGHRQLGRLAELLAHPAPLLDPPDRETFEQVPVVPAFDRGMLSGAEFRGHRVWRADPPVYPAEEVADAWHRVCDVAERNPLFDHIECPGWFALEVARAPAGRWVTMLAHERPRPCQVCGGDGWLGRAVRCPECDGFGTIDPSLEFIDETNPWQSGRVRWQVGRALFGDDHPLFRERHPR